jgi:hypothetical protein
MEALCNCQALNGVRPQPKSMREMCLGANTMPFFACGSDTTSEYAFCSSKENPLYWSHPYCVH